MFEKVPLAAVVSGLVLTVGIGTAVYRVQVNDQKQECVARTSGDAKASACFHGANKLDQKVVDASGRVDGVAGLASATITDAKGKLDTKLAKALNETVPGLRQLAVDTADTKLAAALDAVTSTLAAVRAEADQQLDTAMKAVLAAPGTADAQVAKTRSEVTTRLSFLASQVDGAFASALGAVTEAQNQVNGAKSALQQARGDVARDFADAGAAVNAAFDKLPSANGTVTDAGATATTAPSAAQAQANAAQTQANDAATTAGTNADTTVTDAQQQVTTAATDQVTNAENTAGLTVTSGPSGTGVSVSPAGSGTTAGVSTGSAGTSGSVGINQGPVSGTISLSPVKP